MSPELRGVTQRILLGGIDSSLALFGGIMRGPQVFVAAAVLLLAFSVAIPTTHAAEDHGFLVIVYKDGHRQTLTTAQVERISLEAPATIVYKDGRHEKVSAEIDRIEFADSAFASTTPSRSHYIGKWDVREEANGPRFFITLESNGDATKTLGLPRGTWTLVDGEARISWDDGWHDVISKVGSRHEKRAYEPGKSFDDRPSNVTEARNTEPKPI